MITSEEAGTCPRSEGRWEAGLWAKAQPRFPRNASKRRACDSEGEKESQWIKTPTDDMKQRAQLSAGAAQAASSPREEQSNGRQQITASQISKQTLGKESSKRPRGRHRWPPYECLLDDQIQ